MRRRTVDPGNVRSADSRRLYMDDDFPFAGFRGFDFFIAQIFHAMQYCCFHFTTTLSILRKISACFFMVDFSCL